MQIRKLLFLGEFNLPSVTWKDHRPCGSPSQTDEKFLDSFITLGFTQWISECTFPRSGNVLDLILTSEQDRIGTVQVKPPPPRCDHCSAHCEYLMWKFSNLRRYRTQDSFSPTRLRTQASCTDCIKCTKIHDFCSCVSVSEKFQPPETQPDAAV